jgi:flagellar hook-length control protein FliK
LEVAGKGISMPASVANNLTVNATATPSAQVMKAVDGGGAGKGFTTHLDRAKGAVNAETAKQATAKPETAKPRAAERKTARTGAASTKGAKNAQDNTGDTNVPPPADAGTSGSPIDSTNAVQIAAPSESQPAPSGKEVKNAPPAKAELSAVNVAAVTVTPTQPIQPGDVAAEQKNSGSPGSAQSVIQAVTPDQAASNASPAPSAEANAKAAETVAAFDAKTAKASSATRERQAAVATATDVPVGPAKVAPAKPQTALDQPAVASGNDPTNASAIAVVDAATTPKPAAPDAGDALRGHALIDGAPAAPQPATGHAQPLSDQATPLPPEAHFAEANHTNIVTGVQTTLLPHGGTMQIRLDPPELGALQVTVEMRDGVMNATFHTTNEDATRLLSHSLGQLKTALEAQGVTVEKIQVQQSPKNQQSQNHEDTSQQQQQRDEASTRQEQQRRDMLRRMWRRVSGGDPVDLVA